MIEPKKITITTQSGEDREYIISKFPAIAGREILTQYPTTAMPKVGEYKTNESLMLQLMSYVSVVDNSGNELALSTRGLVDNHVPDWETLCKIEKEMIGYNCSFFGNGSASLTLEGIIQKAAALLVPMLMDSLQQSSAKEPQHTEN